MYVRRYQVNKYIGTYIRIYEFMVENRILCCPEKKILGMYALACACST